MAQEEKATSTALKISKIAVETVAKQDMHSTSAPWKRNGERPKATTRSNEASSLFSGVPLVQLIAFTTPRKGMTSGKPTKTEELQQGKRNKRLVQQA